MTTAFLCWLALGVGFTIGAAWCGLFLNDPDEPEERQ